MILGIRLVPGSRRAGLLTVMSDGVFKIAVRSKPIQGRANLELRKWLAKEFKTSVDSVSIKTGITSRRKVVSIAPPYSSPDWIND